MSDAIFTLCVQFLEWLSSRLGVTYAAINVWIFAILWPIVTLVLAAGIVIQSALIRVLTRKVSAERVVSGKAGKS